MNIADVLRPKIMWRGSILAQSICQRTSENAKVVRRVSTKRIAPDWLFARLSFGGNSGRPIHEQGLSGYGLEGGWRWWKSDGFTWKVTRMELSGTQVL